MGSIGGCRRICLVSNGAPLSLVAVGVLIFDRWTKFFHASVKCQDLSKTPKTNGDGGYGGKVEKYRTKSIKLFLVGVKEKLPTENAKKGRKGAKKWAKYVPEPMAWKINGKNSGNNLEIRKRELPLSVENKWK